MLNDYAESPLNRGQVAALSRQVQASKHAAESPNDCTWLRGRHAAPAIQCATTGATQRRRKERLPSLVCPDRLAGPGRRPFTALTRVRIPFGTPSQGNTEATRAA